MTDETTAPVVPKETTETPVETPVETPISPEVPVEPTPPAAE